MLNIVVNPKALHGKGKRALEKTEERLQKEGVAYRALTSERKGGVSEIVRRLCDEGEHFIVAFGGDGTLNEALCGIPRPEDCVLGLIPAGTGNDFAAAAKIPFGEKALDLILGCEPKPTDYIQFDDGKRSLNIAGLGIDVDILLRCEKKRGANKYFRSLLSSLAHYRGTEIAVTVDGETKEYDAMIAAVCNGTQFGGGIPICPVAQIDDGRMELLVVDFPKRSKILFELIRLMRGKILSRPIVHRISCKEAVIRAAKEKFAQYDGEIFSCESLTARLVSGKLKMYRG